MLYRSDKYGNQISQLGYGCMRFTRKGSSLDYEKAEKELLLAIDRGINYLDSAYIYPGSEELVGRVLAENNCRDKVNLATKLPQYLIRSSKAIDRIFQEELSRLRTDHIDYYLMHMFTDLAEWENLQRFGIEDWIKARKADGSIRNIGFSYHGDSDMFMRILDAYDWDFCQIQYNYLDENSQAGRKGLEYAGQKGIPVVIMEPLRGGKLVNLPDKAKNIIASSGKDYSTAELGLRWLWNQPQIMCVLSGMNSPEMVEENCRIASDAAAGSFDSSDQAVVDQVKDFIRSREKVGCTGCRYCMPCPQGVDIPGNFHYYNLMYMEDEKKSAVRFEFARGMGLRKNPAFASQCIGCGKCEKHCPQHLPIIRELKNAEKALRPFPYKVAHAVMRTYVFSFGNKKKTES